MRTGDWADQAISTVVKIEEELRAAGDEFGLAANRRENAAQLVDYFMEEAKVVYVIYKVWTAGFEAWLIEQGVTPEDLAAEVERLNLLMAYPDGTPLEREPRWEALGLRAGRLANGIRSYDLHVAAAIAELDGVRDDWRMLHDRSADLMAGILAFVVKRFGEAELETCYRAIMEPYLQERYMPFDVRDDAVRGDARPATSTSAWRRCAAISSDRAGAATSSSIEEEDRWVIRFDPCGSGGRILRGDPEEGTGLAGPRAVRVRRDRGSPAVDVGRDGRVPLLRPLQPGAVDDPGRALGPPGADRRSAAVAGRGRPGHRSQVPVDASGSRWRRSRSASTSGSAGRSRRCP